MGIISFLQQKKYSKYSFFPGCLLRKHSPVAGVSVLCRHIHSSDGRRKEDYYKVLGVNRNADAKEIKQAYYKVHVLCCDRS